MPTGAPSLLCPIDFSEFSRQALGYAAAIAGHFGARLIVVSVDDPLLVEAAEDAGIDPPPAVELRSAMEAFCGDTLTSFTGPLTVEYVVAVGKPATEILRVARERGVELIVISSHGRSGMRKVFFGSTTERVLRETTVPVLVTREWRHPFTSLSELARHITRVVAPVDLTEESLHHLVIAQGIATALSARLLAVHVIEPLFVPYRVRAALPGAEQARRSRAEEKLAAMISRVGGAHPPELIVLLGEPAEEIVKLAEARNAGLIVMGLHSSGPLASRMGSTTYRVLCQTEALVLTVPPHVVKATSRRMAAATQAAAR